MTTRWTWLDPSALRTKLVLYPTMILLAGPLLTRPIGPKRLLFSMANLALSIVPFLSPSPLGRRSGSVPVAERPAGGPLFAKLTKGDVVIAPKLDRLFRSALDALKVVEDLKKRGIALHLLDLGGDISGNGLSKLFLTIAAAFAEAERDRIRERIGQVKADQKARGRYLGGKVPFGFRRGESGELVPHEAEQEAIREMVALRGQGKALRAIAEAMQARGHRISHEGVAGVLRTARGGERTYKRPFGSGRNRR